MVRTEAVCAIILQPRRFARRLFLSDASTAVSLKNKGCSTGFEDPHWRLAPVVVRKSSSRKCAATELRSRCDLLEARFAGALKRPRAQKPQSVQASVRNR